MSQEDKIWEERIEEQPPRADDYRSEYDRDEARLIHRHLGDYNLKLRY